jgi:serine/threonine-protein kinase
VAAQGRRWFVKRATTDRARQSLLGACRLHRAVRHEAIVAPERVVDAPDGLTLVYPWCDGTVLNHATVRGSDRSALVRFQALPLAEVHAALDTVLTAHRAVTAAGFVAVDLYDGCFLYDFAAARMRLVDLDEYRPGPFVLDEDRLPGSLRYMAPEEFVRGATIDERTTVHVLGRTLHHLLDSPGGWRGTAAQRAVVERATHPAPARRYPGVVELAAAWGAAVAAG